MVAAEKPRLTFIEPIPTHCPEALADVVRDGLGLRPRRLPCRYFYDAAGSAIFEQICALPEYYPTRTELAILQRSADEMLEAAGGDVSLVELGSGSSRKTRTLIESLVRSRGEARYTAIDISRDFLLRSARALLTSYPRLEITAVAAEYTDGVAAIPEEKGPRLFLFMGSNIGNFDDDEAVEFLRMLRCRMQDDDRLLVGIDLIKDRRVLHAAYNDSAGVTAAFNLNLLARINRELRADFSLTCFAHDAPYVESHSRIEMRLVSMRQQSARVGALGRTYDFDEGESIHTESSHKYTPAGFAGMCARAGLTTVERWTDEREWFAVVLLGPTE